MKEESLQLTSRSFEEGDKFELNDSYNSFTGRSRTIEKFEWEWINTPHGWGSIWLITTVQDGRIVGCFCLIPVTLDYFGRQVLTGKTENGHIHNPFRGKGLYHPFEAKFMQEARERFGILFTTGGPGSYYVRLKSGYSFVGPYANYVKAISIKGTVNTITSVPKAGGLRKMATMVSRRVVYASLLTLWRVFGIIRKQSIDQRVELKHITNMNEVENSWDEFWASQRGKFGITMDRNSSYFKWRIFDNPHLKYKFFLAFKEGDIAGCVITRITTDGQGIISDIVARDNDDRVFTAILDEAARELKKQGAYCVSLQTIRSDNSLNKSLKRNGFIDFNWINKVVTERFSHGAPSGFMSKSLSNEVDQDRLAIPENWYFTELFKEGIQ